MKYKADYSRKYNFKEALLISKPHKCWIKFKKNQINEEPVHNNILGKDIFRFATNGHIILGDDVSSYKFNYIELIDYDWYPVYEVEEEPKETIQPIDTSRIISKGTITDIKKEMVIDGINVTEHIKEICKEEIAKSERYIKATKNINNAFIIANEVVSKADDVKKRNNELLKKINKKQKKPKQKFDGNKKVFINKENNELSLNGYHYTVVGEAIKDSLGYRIATQKDINNFFSGTKKRNNKNYRYFKETRFSDNIKVDERFYKRQFGLCGRIEITEKEYLEGIK